jgi:2,4-dienoyl-CoA reductase-like NADH-dependent reductase (Old Yellow Enzyme family)
MKTLFDQTDINGMALKNRIVRSATWEGMCEADGRPTEKLVNCYRDLARGGTGLIISGYTFVRPDGKQMPGKMGIHTDDFEAEMKALTQAVHDEGGRICIQLVHAGGQTDSVNAGRQPLAPSAVQVDQYPELPQELTVEEIEGIEDDFADAAKRSKDYGFDAVQLHGAHGYLINQFLSPLTNRRTDNYGGSIENRSRFLFEVYGKVRQAVGNEYPVMIKLNGADNLEGGLALDDSVYVAGKLSEAGIDAIEVSAGTPASGDESPARVKIDNPDKEAYNITPALKIKNAVNCPVMLVGGIRSYGVAGKVLNDGLDYVALARPLIREPGLANRWLSGDHSNARCISCNGCFKPGIKEGGIYCVIQAKEREKASKKNV